MSLSNAIDITTLILEGNLPVHPGIEPFEQGITKEGSRTVSEWRRYRFKTRSLPDFRPLRFDARYPWWCVGLSTDCALIVAYLPSHESLGDYWSEAFDIAYTTEPEIRFTAGLPKPKYFKP